MDRTKVLGSLGLTDEVLVQQHRANSINKLFFMIFILILFCEVSVVGQMLATWHFINVGSDIDEYSYPDVANRLMWTALVVAPLSYFVAMTKLVCSGPTTAEEWARAAAFPGQRKKKSLEAIVSIEPTVLDAVPDAEGDKWTDSGLSPAACVLELDERSDFREDKENNEDECDEYDESDESDEDYEDDVYDEDYKQGQHHVRSDESHVLDHENGCQDSHQHCTNHGQHPQCRSFQNLMPPERMYPHQFLPVFRWYILLKVLLKREVRNDIDALFKAHGLFAFTMGFSEVFCLLVSLNEGLLDFPNDNVLVIILANTILMITFIVVNGFSSIAGQMKDAARIEELKAVHRSRCRKNCQDLCGFSECRIAGFRDEVYRDIRALDDVIRECTPNDRRDPVRKADLNQFSPQELCRIRTCLDLKHFKFCCGCCEDHLSRKGA